MRAERNSHVASDSHTNAGRDEAESVVVGRTRKDESKDGGDEARQVEAPLAADNVAQQTPGEGADAESGGESRAQIADVVLRDT